MIPWGGCGVDPDGGDMGIMGACTGAHTIGGKGFGEPLVFDNTYYTTLLGACLALHPSTISAPDHKLLPWRHWNEPPQ